MVASAYDGVYNGIMLIGSNDKDFKLKTPDGTSGTINFNIELYTDGTNKQYCLRLAFDESKRFFMIPTHAIVLMKTKTGKVIELRALYTYDDPNSDKVGYAYFPISEEQLDIICSKDSIVKFRIQTIVGVDHRSTYAENESVWKTDTFGRSAVGYSIKRMVEYVDWQWDLKKDSFASSQKDIRADF